MTVGFLRRNKIGSGGFGTVWTCERTDDGSPFAMKRLKANAPPSATARFAREVRILQALDHPNIVKVVAFNLKEPPFFFVMPQYKRSLRAELPSLIADESRIHAIFGRILDGIEHAHSEGVIHRDLKPENILLNEDADVVVADFGLGRKMDAETSRKTRTGRGMGTRRYCAPEQVLDAKSADARADIYSLGLMLGELFLGSLTTNPSDSKMPAGVAFIVGKCIHEDPAKRFQSVTELKRAWQTMLDTKASKTAEAEFEALAAEATEFGDIDDEKVERLLELLGQLADDADQLHDAMLQLEGRVIARMYEVNSAATRKLIADFCKFAADQPWPFSHTDRIGNRCLSFFRAIEDTDGRLALLKCVMEVGVGHNRYHVMELFGRMLGSLKDGEEVAIADFLNDTPERDRQKVADYVDTRKVPRAVRWLFSLESRE